MSQKIFATALLALGALTLRAQPPQEFEAATIKPVKNQTQSSMRGGPGSSDPSEIRYSGGMGSAWTGKVLFGECFRQNNEN
jgi:hypothetical protein